MVASGRRCEGGGGGRVAFRGEGSVEGPANSLALVDADGDGA